MLQSCGGKGAQRSPKTASWREESVAQPLSGHPGGVVGQFLLILTMQDLGIQQWGGANFLTHGKL